MRSGRASSTDLAEHPDRSASFDAAMGYQAADEAPAAAAAYDWSALAEVVDVGGGNGSLLIALLRAHPTLRGTALDLAAPAAIAARALTTAGLATPAARQELPRAAAGGCGGCIRSRVIHDWDDNNARRILRN